MIIRLVHLLLIACFALVGYGHRIEIDPGEKQCFFETLQPQDKVSREQASVRARASW